MDQENDNSNESRPAQTLRNFVGGIVGIAIAIGIFAFSKPSSYRASQSPSASTNVASAPRFSQSDVSIVTHKLSKALAGCVDVVLTSAKDKGSAGVVELMTTMKKPPNQCCGSDRVRVDLMDSTNLEIYSTGLRLPSLAGERAETTMTFFDVEKYKPPFTVRLMCE